MKKWWSYSEWHEPCSILFHQWLPDDPRPLWVAVPCRAERQAALSGSAFGTASQEWVCLPSHYSRRIPACKEREDRVRPGCSGSRLCWTDAPVGNRDVAIWPCLNRCESCAGHRRIGQGLAACNHDHELLLDRFQVSVIFFFHCVRCNKPTGAAVHFCRL